MIYFFSPSPDVFFALQSAYAIDDKDIRKLEWLFGNSKFVDKTGINGDFIGPRKEMVTPWSTNAVEITQNMGIACIVRIEQFTAFKPGVLFDPMLQAKYTLLDQDLFTINHAPDAIQYIDEVDAYNKKEGLALSSNEVKYLENLSKKIGRMLTDSEIFGFSQVNSEHCRHKIFNGQFVIDGEEQKLSLFQMIKLTTKTHLNRVVSAYKDNCAFLKGPSVFQFAPATQDKPDYFTLKKIESIISLKAETHNFPTTVEPFNGAATGTGGEIRDRIGGGKGAIPLSGTAVYMTSYPRLNRERVWEDKNQERKWLYQTPEEILIKASNGASDFGNKFGQPLTCGSLLTFEHKENDIIYGYDKVIMLAGGIGFGNKQHCEKDIPEPKDKIVLLGGDNYRIGMGGGAVSSVDTGKFEKNIELNAVQRSNPEMQKRVCNAIRALAESDDNPIISIHDHGAGGHLNCLSELVEHTGGKIEIDKLPVGDTTLSDKEIIGNESQERMGLLLKEKDIELLKAISERERAPMYVIGETTSDFQFTFESTRRGTKPLDLNLEDMFGNPPKTIMKDTNKREKFYPLEFDYNLFEYYLEQVLQLESVACKDWLTNKVDRSVTGKVAKQQTAGSIQLPLNNYAISALDFLNNKGIATSIGHAPIVGIIDSAKGSILSISEALTNIVLAPIEDGIKGISLSANWMWPCKNEGEDSRLYRAVKAASDFAIALGINIPTGKDSLSMTQKYPDGTTVYAPGTVIISAAGEVSDLTKAVEPVLKLFMDSSIVYVDFSKCNFSLGGSSFAQILNQLGDDTPTVEDPENYSNAFNFIQKCIIDNKILAGHDVSSGGMITTLLEMAFALPGAGLNINLDLLNEKDLFKILFSEKPAVILQVKNKNLETFTKNNTIRCTVIGNPIQERLIKVCKSNISYSLNIDKYRDDWFKTSYLLDRKQSGNELALKRFKNYKKQVLSFEFDKSFTGKTEQYKIESGRILKSGIKAAIIREKGVNGDREMAYSMYLAGFDVKDVHMTDLISGRETLDDIHFIVFVGGFSNSDVLGSAKGWAGAFLYNDKANQSLYRFYSRRNTLSLGVCNGCQLIIELGLINKSGKHKPAMLFNESHKFESAFINVTIQDNHSVLLKSLAGSRLGIWVAHGEGKFSLPMSEDNYHIPIKYSYDEYPGNPNGSDYSAAAICSDDGRHLAMMPHLERAIFPWNWAYYPEARKNDRISPWIEAFVNAREWIKKMGNFK